ncbi:MAG: glucosamine-6-phosphate deaminase [Sedimentisphaeraceae bacterium JB056]
MENFIFDTKEQMGSAAAAAGAEKLREALQEKGQACIIVATGASQFEMLSSLTKAEGIDWSKITMFHLDEYVGMSESHPASFRKYLKERFVEKLPQKLKDVHFVNGEIDPQAECDKLSKIISECEIDVAFVGIGENGHLAFNDPPADFETEIPFIVVELDEKCRQQQLGEGWFESIDAVPTQAISMSVKQIMKSKNIIVTVPDERKAQAVKDTLADGSSPQRPASILKEHPSCRMYLDKSAASLL